MNVLGIGISFLYRDRTFLILNSAQIAFGDHPVSYYIGPGGFLLGGKSAGA
jgi:hypothetical protein